MKKSKSIILALFCCLLWGLVFPILKLLYAELNITDNYAKVTLAGMRFLSAGILVLIYYRLSFKSFPKIKSIKEFAKLTVLGFFQTALLYAFFFIGSSHITGVKSAVLSQFDIFFIVFLAHFFLPNEKINSKKIIGVILGLVGIVVVNVNSIGSTDSLLSFTLLGEGFLIISGIFAAIGTIIAKKIGKDLNPVLLNGWQLTLGGGLLLIYGLITYGKLISFPNSLSFVLFVSLILVSAVAFTIWYRILRHVKASEITIYKFMIPIIGAIASAIIVPGESLSIYSFLGLILVSVGIYFSNKK
ncbi:MAG: DMT family transporter [Clostridiales bacterium]|nr:DMT family transporter [Clostridiales bacterium]